MLFYYIFWGISASNFVSEIFNMSIFKYFWYLKILSNNAKYEVRNNTQAAGRYYFIYSKKKKKDSVCNIKLKLDK